MNSRRDWLKFFGAGAVIVPIIGAKADESQAAQLIEVPHIKPVELFASIPKPIDLRRNVTEAVLLVTLRDGTKRRLKIDNPQGWGTIELRTDSIEVSFTENTSPISAYGSIAGGFAL